MKEERKGGKSSLQMPTGLPPSGLLSPSPTCTRACCAGTVTQRPHAAQRAAAGRRRADGRAAGTVRLRGPETFIVPSPLPALLFLPLSQAFFMLPSLLSSLLSLFPSSLLSVTSVSGEEG